MSRRNVECVTPDSPSHYIPRYEAHALVNAREAEWVDTRFKVIRKFKRDYSVRGFSSRYGERLAKIRKTSIGMLMLSEITRRPMEVAT